MRLFLVIAFGALICYTSGCSRSGAGHDAAPTDEDIDHFEALMEPGNRADAKEVKKSFRRCFKKGQPVWRYEKILSKARKNEYPPGQKDSYMYVWTSAHGYDGCVFYVYVAGEPPVITRTGIEFPDF
jgi:hypothetical protein